MNAGNLMNFQNNLKEKIYNLADEYGLLDGGYEPLYDGVCDASAYVNSDLKIMWVLKEAYCKSEGDYGGWSLTEDLFGSYPYKKNIKNPTHQKMAYVSYGILNKCRYGDIDYIGNDPSVGDVLHEIAYINLNKMPAGTSTYDNTLWEKYDTWKNVLWKQIKNYKPDVIIFGNTFRYFQNDFFDLSDPDSSYTDNIGTDARADIYTWNGTVLIDTNHPQWTECQGDWANAIIEACEDYCSY